MYLFFSLLKICFIFFQLVTIKTRFTVLQLIDFMMFYFATCRVVPYCLLVKNEFQFANDRESDKSDQQKY